VSGSNFANLSQSISQSTSAVLSGMQSQDADFVADRRCRPPNELLVEAVYEPPPAWVLEKHSPEPSPPPASLLSQRVNTKRGVSSADSCTVIWSSSFVALWSIEHVPVE